MTQLTAYLIIIGETLSLEERLAVYFFFAVIVVLAVGILRSRDLISSSALRKLEKRYVQSVFKRADQGDPDALFSVATYQASGGVKFGVIFHSNALMDASSSLVDFSFIGKQTLSWTPKSRATLVRAAREGSIQAKEAIASLLMEKGQPESGAFWRELAEREVPNALVTLGQGYLAGSVVLQTAREPEIASRYFKRAVERGYGPGTFLLGNCYRQGLGVDQDHKRAMELYEIAIQQGVVAAEYALGVMLLSGEGIEMDRDRGIQMVREAAELGNQDAIATLVHESERDNPYALTWLAITCANGVNFQSAITGRVFGPQDTESLLLRAASLDRDYAMLNLGALYESRKDWERAEAWYRQAIVRGNLDAASKLGTLFLTKRFRKTRGGEAIELLKQGVEGKNGAAATALAALYSRGEFVPQNDEEAFKLFQLGAEQGELDSVLELGERYMTGVGTAVDLEEAVKHFSRAALAGSRRAFVGLRKLSGRYKSASAARELGVVILRQNILVSLNRSTQEAHANTHAVQMAIYWFRKAAKRGDARAMRLLADAIMLLVLIRRRGARKFKQAFQWYKRAAELGDMNATMRLGDCYAYGCGVQMNEEEAIKQYEEASERGNVDAILELVYRYYSGQGVAKDVEKARELARRAATTGNLDAQDWLNYYEFDPKPDPCDRPARQEEFLTSL